MISKSTLAAAALALAACSSSASPAVDGSAAPATPQEQALRNVKDYITGNLDTLVTATTALQAAAPAPDDDGWNATTDAAALTKMRDSWRQARAAYEHIEGAIAVLFPELDVSTDERYDGFLEAGADDDLFDDQGVTGVHAVERILWANETRPEVVAFEAWLKGYKAAAFPASRAEAAAFKNQLCARLVADVTMMRTMFTPLALDPAAAYRGVIGSLGEQIEKVEKAATGEEESRYANETLADMRANLAGGLATVEAFKAWLTSKSGGADFDAKIRAGFQRVSDAYALYPGAAIPPPPATWSSISPSAADLATPFGQLYTLLRQEADEMNAGGTVSQMNAAATLMGIPVLPP